MSRCGRDQLAASRPMGGRAGRLRLERDCSSSQLRLERHRLTDQAEDLAWAGCQPAIGYGQIGGYEPNGHRKYGARRHRLYVGGAGRPLGFSLRRRWAEKYEKQLTSSRCAAVRLRVGPAAPSWRASNRRALSRWALIRRALIRRPLNRRAPNWGALNRRAPKRESPEPASPERAGPRPTKPGAAERSRARPTTVVRRAWL